MRPDPDALRFDLTPREAVALQRELAGRVTQPARRRRVRRVAGVDAGFPDRGRRIRVACVLFSFPALEPLEEVTLERRTPFPYVPGLLSFREVPAMLEALAGLAQPPDLVLVDGQGRAHPRRFGSACHLALASGLVTVGVGKSRLCGEHADPGAARGACAALVDRGEHVGNVLRTRAGVRPVYVSVGSGIDLGRATELVLESAPRYRLPEPIRAADRLASRRG
ncbi:MAG: endonuclease V [Gammaproteobacteria bacterium]